jgi:hypothetical protein
MLSPKTKPEAVKTRITFVCTLAYFSSKKYMAYIISVYFLPKNIEWDVNGHKLSTFLHAT